MTALEASSPDRPEVLARQTLTGQGAWSAAVGAIALIGARPVGRAVGLPTPVVALAGVGAAGAAVTLTIWAIGEDWKPATRRVVVGNVLITAALVGHATVRGTTAGRLGVLGLAAQALGFAAAQTRALVAAEPSTA